MTLSRKTFLVFVLVWSLVRYRNNRTISWSLRGVQMLRCFGRFASLLTIKKQPHLLNTSTCGACNTVDWNGIICCHRSHLLTFTISISYLSQAKKISLYLRSTVIISYWHLQTFLRPLIDHNGAHRRTIYIYKPVGCITILNTFLI